MKTKLRGWELTEGMVAMLQTRNPSVSAVINALEAIRPDVPDPFIILAAPAAGDAYPNYCQAFAAATGYCCEIRIFSGRDDFSHFRAYLPDPEGETGEEGEPLLPNLAETVRAFIGFIANPGGVPEVDTLEWMDVTEELDARED